MAGRPEIEVVGAVGGERRRYAWWSELSGPPERGRCADDRLGAAEALRRARAGEALAWTGDWHNARQLLAAMARRLYASRPRGSDVAAAFRAEREGKRVENAVLTRLAVPIGPGWESPLSRAPPLRGPLEEAFGAGPDRASLMPLREILGAIGAHEWFRRGVPVPALGGTVHPRYGVFAPVRGEYVGLVARALSSRSAALGLNEGALAFDLGTGTGVLAILLARAGARVIATDLDRRALASARENAARFGVDHAIQVLEADLFPAGRARLLVANPPWIPELPHGPLDRAVYDPGGMVLQRLVDGLRDHLDERGEAWLILSDLAEHLGLRAQGTIDAMISTAGLRVAATWAARPSHPRAGGGERRSPGRAARDDLVAAARAAETTRLYVLTA